MKRRIQLIIMLLFTVTLAGCISNTNRIVFENKYFKYEIDSSGKNLRFIDKQNNVDYLDRDNNSLCASVKKDDKVYSVTDVSLEGTIFKLNFGDAGVTSSIQVTSHDDHIIFTVKEVTGDPWSMTFVNVPLSLEGMSYEPFGACILAMNLNTHVTQLPALQTLMTATCYKKLGMEGSEVAMLGLPQEKVLPVIREVVKNAENIPFSDQGGAWAQMAKEGFGSYLMVGGGQLTEETVDEWIETCKSLGFNQIDIPGHGGIFKYGSFEINKERYPDGWESFKRINERLHEAGISPILHTYSFFIDKNSNFITPVPDEGLGYFNSFTLASPIDATSDEIIVNESTADISNITGFWVRNSTTLRIGKELISFSDVTKNPPYKFTGCKRGIHGTTASGHPANDKAYHLMEMFGRFVPGEDTDLFKNIAKRTARVVDDCKFDGIYFDAADGSDLWGGEEFYWHYGPKFVFEVAKNLKKPVGMEMAGMTHLWWHYRSRWQAWDSPVRGYKRFVDIHLASVKSTTYKHGEFLGHTPVIDKLSRAEHSPLLLPLFLGWWRNCAWSPDPQIEMTHTDDIEYLCCKMIGNNAGLCVQGAVDKKAVAETPLLGDLHAMIKQYEELRHEKYFSDSVRELLREPGKDFTLFKEDDGDWNFKPVVYDEHKVTGLNDASDKWTVNNGFSEQQLKLRIQPLMSVKPYHDSSNILLTDCSPGEFRNEGSAEGVTGEIVASSDLPENANNAVSFSAMSSGSSPKEGSWIKMEKLFDPWINLEKNQALGVWVKGDGSGQLLNLRIANPKHIGYAGVRGDHFIDIDFTGWRYFELIEVESKRFSDYIWETHVETREIPEGFNVYNSYRGRVNLGSVDKLQFWFNNLPVDKKVNCVIGPVKAIPIVPITISNPTVTIGNETIVFPVKLESGMYLELRADRNCKLYSQKGEVLQEITLDSKIPLLKHGNNSFSFSCDGPEGVSSRVKVTIISEGNPL
ncbi:MAG: hypothetical protein ACOX19_00870 [Fermentimonas sp.]